MLRCIWLILNPLSIHVTFTAIVPGAYPGEAKMCKKCAKIIKNGELVNLRLELLGKRLKVDGHMLRGVWQALNSLSIHVTFTAVVPGAYPGEAKMCKKNVLKWRTFELSGWITGKRLKIDVYMLRCVWQALNSLYIHIKETDTRSVGDSHLSCYNISVIFTPLCFII